MKRPPEYAARFELENNLQLELRMFDHHEYRWNWTHRYMRRPDGRRAQHEEDAFAFSSRGTQPEIVNDLRITAKYLDGILQLPLKVAMNVVIPSRLGQRYIGGCDISPGAKTYIEFHYGDPDDARCLRLMRIEVGALQFVDLPREVSAEAGVLVGPAVDFPFLVPGRLPFEWGCYRFPFMVEESVPVKDDIPQWPTVNIAASIRVREIGATT